jgi:predicted TIM-barrel fold metal-dependent hydrolase
VPIIDFHTHVFPPEIIAKREVYVERDAWFKQLYANRKARMASAEDLITAMERGGVEAAVTFGFAWADQGLCRESNDYVLEAASRWPQRLVGFAVINPVARGAASELERCMQRGLVGLGELMPDGQGYAMDDPYLGEAVQQMSDWRRPVLIHAGEPVGHGYPGKSKATLQSLCQLALRHPQATFVAAHWGGGLFFYELMPEVRNALRNVYYDTAASLYLYSDDIFAVAARIIPHKALLGTDYPLIDQERFLRRVRASGIAADDLAAMLGGNAAKLLEYGGPEGSLGSVTHGG